MCASNWWRGECTEGGLPTLNVACCMQVVKNSEVIFLAVKPQYVSVVLKEVKLYLTDEHIVVSIAAGIPLAVMKVNVQPLHIKTCCSSLQ